MELNKLHHGISYDDYALVGGVRASGLKLAKRSMAHYKAGQEPDDEPSEAKLDGKIIHALLENPEKFMDTFVVEPEFTGRTKDGRESSQSGEAREKKKQWYADLAPGTEVVTAKQLEICTGVYKAVMGHGLVKNLMAGSVRETSLFTTDPETGLLIQCRPDLITQHGFVVDFKSTRDASPAFFLNQIFSDRYEESPFYILAAAHYAHCVKSAGIGPGTSFTFVAIEKKKPFGIRVYPVDVGGLDVGERWRAKLMRQLATAIEKDEWPCYEERAYPVVPPEWVSVPIDEEFYEEGL